MTFHARHQPTTFAAAAPLLRRGSEPAVSLAHQLSRHRRDSTASNSSASSTSTHSSTASEAPPMAGPPFGDVTAAEFVLAMHDFEPVAPNATCLSFKAGQLIRVLNRDPTGWWDGELDGRRGWFPSNYVDASTGSTAPKPASARRPRSSHSRIKAASISHSVSRAPSSPYATSQMDEGGELPTHPHIMTPIVHALGLLQNAVRARRITHFAPSTACVISCVRSVLSATDCLSRDSSLLMEFPVLAHERKHVLSELARLVNQAKAASQSGLSEEVRVQTMSSMLQMGDSVFARVRMFLLVAVECGVELPERRTFGSPSPGNTPYSEDPPHEGSPVDHSPGTSVQGSSRHMLSAKQRAAALRAKSMGDLRRQRAAPLYDDPAADSADSASDYFGSTSRGGSRVHPRERVYLAQDEADNDSPLVPGAHWGPKDSISSSSSLSSYESSRSSEGLRSPQFPSGPTSTSQVLFTLRATHDRLLSIIAAFIGHVHSHSRSAHASSKGHLIEMTRETVDQVRHLLALVDSVLANPNIAEAKPREVGGLEQAKNTLFTFTSSLVDSIRAMTTPPAPDNEDEEKAASLQAATGALRAGGDCVTALKMCLARRIGEEPFVVNIVVPPLPDSPPQGHHHHESISSSRSHSRSRNTLSYLGRKSSSLTALRAQYAAQENSDNGSPRTIPEHMDGEELPDETVKYPHEQDLTIHAARAESYRDHLRSEPTSRNPSFKGSDSTNDSKLSLTGSDGETPATSSRNSSETDAQFPVSADSASGKHHNRERVSISTDGGSAYSQADGLPLLRTVPPDGAQLPTVEEGKAPSAPQYGGDDESSHPGRNEVWLHQHDHDERDVAYNADGLLTGATLDVLVEMMTLHNSTPDPSFSVAFYLTFHHFTTATELLDVLLARFDIEPPAEVVTTEDFQLWQQHKALPIRLRVSNFIKTWLEAYWQPEVDNYVLERLQTFVRDQLSTIPMLASQSRRLMGLIKKRAVSEQPITSRGLDGNKSAEHLGDNLPTASAPVGVPPAPVMSKTLFAGLRNNAFISISITDFDVLELARQITVMESKLYCAIPAREVLEAGVRRGTHVMAMSTLSTAITGWVTESILNEPDTRKRTVLVKYFIKLADRCVGLHNFSTLRSILAALDSSMISRLTKTWAALPNKSKVVLEAMRKITDHTRNHAEYRSRLRRIAPPAVPFVGLYLTDITFCREGNPALRPSPKDENCMLINFTKYHKLARIVQDMQRFQSPYPLLEIPEVQKYLYHVFAAANATTDLQDLYRRSLLVEPRQPTDQNAGPPTVGDGKSGKSDLFAWASRTSTSTAPAL